MPFYQKQGTIPEKRHIQFRDKGNRLIWEELVSRKGFSGIYSNAYHKYPPTKVKRIGNFEKIHLKSIKEIHRPHHLLTAKLNLLGDYLSSRVPLFFNSNVVISKAHCTDSMDYLYRNGCSDELLFIHSGKGIFKSNFGNIKIKSGDYIVIPRGVIWQVEIFEPLHILIIESYGAINTPSNYRNEFGQLLEHSPFCERDIKTPEFIDPVEGKDIEVKVKVHNGIQSYIYQHHPFDLVGWDGYYFPYVFNICDFMPITGKIHQPPPVHQTFQGDNFVICSFVPRLFDYHKNSIPAPYAHSNVDSDEIIFYSDGKFMSRSGVEKESITYHPMGLPHGPQPGKIEESIGKKETNETAVMIDTFNPLNMTSAITDIDDKEYPLSWIEL